MNERPGSTTSLDYVDDYERRLRTAVLTLKKRGMSGITLVEAIDEAQLWPDSFEDQQPFLPGVDISVMFDRAPLLLCAIASEIGFRFEGVGTVYWNKLENALGCSISMSERAMLGDVFMRVAEKCGLSRPSASAFSVHFSIISWPISNALLPLDLLGPVTRLLARAPSAAMPGPGRSANFPSLRAWAAAAEGARLVDWLRLENSSERVLTALLIENRNGGISAVSYQRLQDAIIRSSEAFFSTRIARQRAKRTKATAGQGSLGRLTLVRDAVATKLFVSWPSMPLEIVDEAKAIARAAGWRPQLWSAGARLHSDTALGDGPFLLTHADLLSTHQPAFGAAAAIFGEGSLIANALAGRKVDWSDTLLFDVNDERTLGEQRVAPFDATTGTAWIACAGATTPLNTLREIGAVCGYKIFEADLGREAERAILAKEGMTAQGRMLAARHPIDAISAPQSVVRPGRPFVVYKSGPPIEVGAIQSLRDGDRFGYGGSTGEQPRLRCELQTESPESPLNISILERDSAFSALIERRLQVRIESNHALRLVPITTELEIDGALYLRCTSLVGAVPCLLDRESEVLRPLYHDSVRSLLLARGTASLRFFVGRLAEVVVVLRKPVGIVDWSVTPPKLSSAEAAKLVSSTALSPHSFSLANQISTPGRGAIGFALQLADGRLADPMKVVASSSFNLGDFAANFTNDLGCRLVRDGGRGNLELAQAKIAWARAECDSLPAFAAKSRVVPQFDQPLVYNLCGREWLEQEQGENEANSDPHETLYLVALKHGLASIPVIEHDRFASTFASAFAQHARRLDPDWPIGRAEPLDGAMDDALNLGFADAVGKLHLQGELIEVDPDDCDFGSTDEAWTSAAKEAIRRIQRSHLAQLIAPTAGGRQLRDRFYTNTDVAEASEDLAAWTRTFSLARGRLTPEAAASALQLWLSPAGCNSVDQAIRVLVNDPFVARASRYMAIRLKNAFTGEIS